MAVTSDTQVETCQVRLLGLRRRNQCVRVYARYGDPLSQAAMARDAVEDLVDIQKTVARELRYLAIMMFKFTRAYSSHDVGVGSIIGPKIHINRCGDASAQALHPFLGPS